MDFSTDIGKETLVNPLGNEKAGGIANRRMYHKPDSVRDALVPHHGSLHDANPITTLSPRASTYERILHAIGVTPISYRFVPVAWKLIE